MVLLVQCCVVILSVRVLCLVLGDISLRMLVAIASLVHYSVANLSVRVSCFVLV